MFNNGIPIGIYLVIQYFKNHFHYVYKKFHVQLTIK